MRAQQLGRLGRVDRRSWLGRARDALDGLVKSSPSRFAILIFASLIVVFTVLFSLPIASARPPEHARSLDALFTAVSVDLRHRPLHRRHGDVLVAVRQHARLHRRGDRRHRRADARVDPRSRDLATPRPAAEADRGERLEPVAHPRRARRRAPGGPPRRDRQPARHGRDQRAGHRSDDRARDVPAHARRGIRRLRTSVWYSSTTRRWRSRTPDSAPTRAASLRSSTTTGSSRC